MNKKQLRFDLSSVAGSLQPSDISRICDACELEYDYDFDFFYKDISWLRDDPVSLIKSFIKSVLYDMGFYRASEIHFYTFIYSVDELIHGIDKREIRCAKEFTKNSIRPGISFDYDSDMLILRFHYLDYINDVKSSDIVKQFTKAMYIDKGNAKRLIKVLERFVKSQKIKKQ